MVPNTLTIYRYAAPVKIKGNIWMKTFFDYIKMRESAVDNPDGAVSGSSEEQIDALEKAIRLAFDRYPSQVKEFFRSLQDKEIDELSGDFEKQPSHDKAAEMFGRKRTRSPDEVVPSHADSGLGDSPEWTSRTG